MKFKILLRPLLLLSLGTVLYLFNIRLPYFILIMFVIVRYINMPKTIDSFFSRFIVGFILLFAFLQLSELFQFVLLPSGGFKLITILTAVFTLLTIFIFGEYENVRYRFIKVKDVFAIVGATLFILCFTPIFLGGNQFSKITEIGAVQVADSVAHYGSISGYGKVQNLNYRVNEYYPSGFELSTAWVQDSIIGDINSKTWKEHVVIYVMQYIIFALLFNLIIIYFGYQILELLGGAIHNKWLYFFNASTLGVCSLIMFSLVFINEGFLNYFYIVATLILAIMYILNSKLDYNEVKNDKNNKNNNKNYIWPLSAFLLLGFGASLSWPLVTPSVLLSVGFLLYKKISLKTIYSYFKNHLIIIFLITCNLTTVLLQAHYMKNGSSILLYGGGLSSLNTPFLLTSIIVIFVYVLKDIKGLGRRIGSVSLPYVFTVTALLGWHLLVLGEVRYYVIKSAFIIFVIGAVLGIALLILWLEKLNYTQTFKFFFLIFPVLLLLLVTIEMSPMPLNDIRGLFRQISKVGKPPYVESDSLIISSLGLSNKIDNFNLTALHYDYVGKRFFAHAETALWANAMTSAYQDVSASITGARSTNCYSKQYAYLAYSSLNGLDEGYLISSVNECIDKAKQNGMDYYIVTDKESAPQIRKVFGSLPKVLY